VPTATQTEIGAAAVISADAIDQGDGGSVAVWSDALTIYSGNIYARGGAQGGNGGFVEVSSKQQLNFGGSVSTAAPAGLGGTLLLDPADIKIVAPGLEDSDEQVGDNVVLHGESAGDTFSISKNTVNGLNGTVVLQATNDISIEANLDLDADTLVLQAGNDISISHHVKFNAAGTGKRLHIEADSPHTGSVSDGVGSVTINGDIDANGGNVVLMGAGFTINNDIKANSVELSLSQPGALTITAGALGHLIGTNVTIGRATSAGDNGLGGITATTSTVTALNVEAFDHDTTHLTLISGGHLTFSGNVTAATVTALAGQTTDGTLSFAGTPTAIKADEITLQAGVGSGTGSLVVTTNGVFTSTDGNDRPAKFVLSQDANLVDSTLPDPTTQFPKGVPTDYQVGSLGGFLNLTDATKFQDPLGIGPQEPQLSLSAKGGVTLAPVGALSLASLSMTGTAVTVGALSSTGNITLTGIGSGAGEGNVTVAGAISGGGNFIIRASGDALVDFSVTAPVIDVAGGTDDSGNVVLGSLAAIQLLADAQTYTAGTDSGTGGTNKIDIDSAKFGSMTAPPANWSLALVQDAKATDAAGDPTLPAPATGFVAGLPTTFVVRSRDDAVEITSVLDNDKTALTVSGLSTVKIKGGKLKLIDVQLGDALLGGNLTLTQTASFAHKLDADSGVVTAELEVGDNATFTGSVGSTATLPPLVKVNVKGFTTFGAQASKVNVTTQHYEKQVTLGTSATFSGTNATFAGGIKGVGGPSATFAFTETVKLNGAETIVDLTSNGLGGTTDLSGTISTSGDQVYNTGVSLSGAVVIQADSVSFKHITGAQPLKVEGVGGAATADATFGGIVSTQSLWVRGKSRINAISITTTGFQTYAGDVTLGAGTTGLKGDTLRFGGKIDGATAGESALVLEATNAGNPLVRFDQAVGTVALGQLSVTGKTTVDGGAVKTVQVAGTFDGKQIYTDTVTLGGPTLFQGTTAAFPAIDGTVVSKHNLTLNFSGNQSISGTTLLNIGDLDTDALGTTTITGSLTTERTQTYRDPVKLTGAATTLKGTIISLLNTADATVVAGQNLTVDGSAVLGSSVNTTGTQVYNGPVQLTGAGSGTHTLTASLVNTKSTVSVAPGAGVRSLAVVGNAQLDANVTTSGRQTYSGAVTINGATVTLTTPLSLGFGDVVDSALAGTNTLKIDAPLSTFAGNVGSTKALLALDVDSAASLGGGSYTTTGAQTYRQNVTLAGGGLAADQVVKAAQTTFSGKINASGSTQSLKLEGLASAVTFENSVGFDDPLKSLRVEGTEHHRKDRWQR
jgi:hypothetical protein